MGAWGWAATAIAAWLIGSLALAMIIGRAIAPTWWERLLDDIEQLPTTEGEDGP